MSVNVPSAIKIPSFCQKMVLYDDCQYVSKSNKILCFFTIFIFKIQLLFQCSQLNLNIINNSSLNIYFYTSKLVCHDSHHHHCHHHHHRHHDHHQQHHHDDHHQMTSMLKIENMASTAGGEAEGVKENLVMRMMMRLLVRMKMMTMRAIMMIMRMRLTIISVMR